MKFGERKKRAWNSMRKNRLGQIMLDMLVTLFSLLKHIYIIGIIRVQCLLNM